MKMDNDLTDEILASMEDAENELKEKVLAQLDGCAGGLASKEELSDIITTCLVTRNQLISIDYNDVLMAINGMSEVDGVTVAGKVSSLYSMLKEASARLSAAHGGKSLSSLLIGIGITKDGNFTVADLDGVRQYLSEMGDDISVIWGVAHNSDLSDDEVRLSILFGYK